MKSGFDKKWQEEFRGGDEHVLESYKELYEVFDDDDDHVPLKNAIIRYHTRRAAQR